MVGGPHGAARWRIERHEVVDSTQAVLKRRLATGEDVAWLAVRAAAQTAGRGRRGGEWRSGLGGSYTTFAVPEAAASGAGAWASLAVGVGVAEALAGAGHECLVKWPNDLYYGGAKLGGILVERVKGHLLIGIGINVDNEPPPGGTGLAGLLAKATVDDLVVEGVDAALRFVEAGSDLLPDDLRRRFAARDWLSGKRVTVQDAVANAADTAGRERSAPTTVTGVACGIAPDGSLLVAVRGRAEPYRVWTGTIGTHL